MHPPILGRLPWPDMELDCRLPQPINIRMTDLKETPVSQATHPNKFISLKSIQTGPGKPNKPAVIMLAIAAAANGASGAWLWT
ncbi:hypothetical protein FA13DRAFT_1729879 [Coprinellus micaceus]|uniref:Uncharacterized protein n=1 Tax=Coprinellus micaceus TaxID=71717 RepID=A0A4Y7TJP2_COPMI|nr:hypothetical protein FA13DRAFT_1729879 [Coprinellus micaceus]